jgi:formate--tetrahydrofolate ligase
MPSRISFVAKKRRAGRTPTRLVRFAALVKAGKVRAIGLSNEPPYGVHEVVRLAERGDAVKFVYDDQDSLWDKMKKVATKIYGAADISAPAKIKQQLKAWEEAGYGHYPICVAKTQSSFSSDATMRGAPSGHMVNIREVRLAAGAQFIVMICGDIMTMPGLPKVPSAEKIDIDENGKVVGLF